MPSWSWSQVVACPPHWSWGCHSLHPNLGRATLDHRAQWRTCTCNSTKTLAQTLHSKLIAGHSVENLNNESLCNCWAQEQSKGGLCESIWVYSYYILSLSLPLRNACVQFSWAKNLKTKVGQPWHVQLGFEIILIKGIALDMQQWQRLQLSLAPNFAQQAISRVKKSELWAARKGCRTLIKFLKQHGHKAFLAPAHYEYLR